MGNSSSSSSDSHNSKNASPTSQIQPNNVQRSSSFTNSSSSISHPPQPSRPAPSPPTISHHQYSLYPHLTSSSSSSQIPGQSYSSVYRPGTNFSPQIAARPRPTISNPQTLVYSPTSSTSMQQTSAIRPTTISGTSNQQLINNPYYDDNLPTSSRRYQFSDEEPSDDEYDFEKELMRSELLFHKTIGAAQNSTQSNPNPILPEELDIVLGPSNRDCISYFFKGNCRYKSNCRYRHNEEALKTLTVCPAWKEKRCTEWSACPMRHMTQEDIDKLTKIRIQPTAQTSFNPSSSAKCDSNKDCKFFFKHGRCNFNDHCKFRHNVFALTTTAVCLKWKAGNCSLIETCPLRHAREETIEVFDPNRPQRQRRKNKNSRKNPNQTNDQSKPSTSIQPSKEEVKELECCICLRSLTEIKTSNEKLASIDCGHIMCLECSNRIVETDGICPLCRQVIRQRPRVLYA